MSEIVSALRDGQAPDRVLNPFAMPWPLFHNFTSDDATAIATYLKSSSQPVHNLIPPKLSYGLVETVVQRHGFIVARGTRPTGARVSAPSPASRRSSRGRVTRAGLTDTSPLARLRRD